jgi:hypothetical protein
MESGVPGIYGILMLVMGFFLLIIVPIITYHQGKKRGKLEGRMEEMEKNRRLNSGQ